MSPGPKAAPTAPRPSVPPEPGEAPSVPAELHTFFGGKSSRILTVRGAPGVGKTSFALELLRSFDGYRLSVSASVTREALLEQFPWLGAPGARPIDVVEFLRFRTTTRGSGLSVDQLRSSLQERATDLVELSQVLSLPPELHGSLAAHAGERKMVVIDSWEAWIENLLGPSPLSFDVPTTRWELERSILGQILEAGAHIVLVVERQEPSRLEYLVDGSVMLSEIEFEGRQQRWASLTKLRGTRIEVQDYPFTLDGGHFRSLPPISSRGTRAPIYDVPDPQPTDPSLWPGTPSFAGWFGRLPVPGRVLVEADNETSDRALWALTAPCALAALRAGSAVVVRPPPGFTGEMVWEDLLPRTSADLLASSLRILGVTTRGGPPSPLSQVFLDPSPEGTGTPGTLDPLLTSLRAFLRNPARPTQPSLALGFPDPDVGTAREAEEGRTDPFLLPGAKLREMLGPTTALVVMRSEDPRISRVRVQSLVHLMVRSLRGHLFVYGVRPWTPLLVPVPAGAPAGAPGPYRLRPVI